MPEDLKVGDTFRLTGHAEDPEEAADTRHFIVRKLCPQYVSVGGTPILSFLHMVVDAQGKTLPLGIGAWVPLVRVEAS